jgi:hypothetical protein
LLSCAFSLFLLSPRAALAALPLGAVTMMTSTVGDFFIERMDRLDTYSGEEFVRIAQLIAAWNRIEENPIGAFTGFGIMASHHLDWFGRGFAVSGLDEYSTVGHNSLVDLLLAFGLLGGVLAARFLRRLSLSTVGFLLLSSSFINVLAFAPFYLAVAVAVAFQEGGSQRHESPAQQGCPDQMRPDVRTHFTPVITQ